MTPVAGAGTITTPTINPSRNKHQSRDNNSEYRGPILRPGARVPHCWFTFKTGTSAVNNSTHIIDSEDNASTGSSSGGSSQDSSDIGNDGQHTTASNEHSADDNDNVLPVISTVNLTGWLHILELKSYEARNSAVLPKSFSSPNTDSAATSPIKTDGSSREAAAANSTVKRTDIAPVDSYPKPKLLLLVDASEIEMWRQAIRSSVKAENKIVAIPVSTSSASSTSSTASASAAAHLRKDSVGGGSIRSDISVGTSGRESNASNDDGGGKSKRMLSQIVHEILQERHQDPRHSIAVDDAPISNCQDANYTKNYFPLIHNSLNISEDLSTHSSNSGTNSSATSSIINTGNSSEGAAMSKTLREFKIERVELCDITGRWMEKCNEYRQLAVRRHKRNSTSLDRFVPVAIRPDGHVAALYCEPTNMKHNITTTSTSAAVVDDSSASSDSSIRSNADRFISSICGALSF
jgi:hypothetical protein